MVIGSDLFLGDVETAEDVPAIADKSMSMSEAAARHS
jgi:hypothetical protein